MRRFVASLIVTVAVILAAPTAAYAQAGPPQKVEFMGAAQSPISSGVAVPAGAAWFWTSGTVPTPADPNAAAGSRERYGDTKTQAISALKAVEARLKERGLGLKDVIFIRAFLVTDKEKGSVDFAGWNEAYGMFFNNATNPTKVARSTLAVAGLVSPEWLIEIEAVAVYPK
ncbi:MAG: RidA family protein [Gemmatimonadaceae bacterium]